VSPGPGGQAAILAVDGGNSKADVALLDRDGNLLAATRGPTISHQAVGLDVGMDRLAALAAEVAETAGRDNRTPVAEVGVFSLAGADYPSDIRMLTRAIDGRRLVSRTVVVNDTFGALRAGTDQGWGVVLICGQGVNASAIAPDGRSATFPAVGDIAGDWGGGTSVGMEGLRAAVRARDGRGRRTSLERLVPAHFRLGRPASVTRAMYDGRIAQRRVGELSPIVFAAATAGDAVARSIVDRLADELATMGTALIRRLHLGRFEPDVVLGGGVFRATDPGFYERLERLLREAAPGARLVRQTSPPVAGTALLGLDRLAGTPVAAATSRRVRDAFTRWDASVTADRG
jgi:N-acetylglucosamine kinase-like BadF-type ATPase